MLFVLPQLVNNCYNCTYLNIFNIKANFMAQQFWELSKDAVLQKLKHCIK